MPTQLTCIICDCPLTGQMVDWRRCRDCPHYASQERIGTVDCLHPQADPTPHPDRWAGLRESWGVLHVTLCDPPQTEEGE